MARQERYWDQCSCHYWHGSFGGLYLPQLRNEIYQHGIAMENGLDGVEGKVGPQVSLNVADFNLDFRQEIRLENDHFVAFVRPAMEGHIYEFEVRRSLKNLLNTLDRRTEIYHETIAAMSRTDHEAMESTKDHMFFTQSGLETRLFYDNHPRKALNDHFQAAEMTSEDMIECRDTERGDFVTRAYLSKVLRTPEKVGLIMDRVGRAEGHLIRVRKALELVAGSTALDVRYVLEDLPVNVPLQFEMEINIAAMAGHADDRYYSDSNGERLGMLDASLEFSQRENVCLSGEWLDFKLNLNWSRSADLWTFHVKTVSQSQSGYECVYQSSVILPRWVVVAKESRRWEVRVRWAVGRVASGGPSDEMNHAELLELASKA